MLNGVYAVATTPESRKLGRSSLSCVRIGLILGRGRNREGKYIVGNVSWLRHTVDYLSQSHSTVVYEQDSSLHPEGVG